MKIICTLEIFVNFQCTCLFIMHYWWLLFFLVIRMIYFGTRLKELRIAYNLTQAQLAQAIGLVKSSISSYEKGLKYPSVEVLIKLCNYFKVSSDYLLGISDYKEINKYDITEEQREIITKLLSQFTKLNK